MEKSLKEFIFLMKKKKRHSSSVEIFVNGIERGQFVKDKKLTKEIELVK